MLRSFGFPLIPVNALVVTSLVATLVSGCGKKQEAAPPMATPSVTLSRDKVPLGGPIDITYKFVVASDAAFKQDYRVMVHVVDPNEELMWTDDHEPPVPTKEWKPGQTIEYTRTVFVPVYPYVGEAVIQVGLYGQPNEPRVVLAGEDVGQRAYRVARLQLAPQSEAVFSVYKDGWHPAEQAEHNAMVEWHWTKKVATLAVRNPKRDCVLYLELDNPGGVFDEAQQVTVSAGREGAAALDQFTIVPGKKAILRKIPMPATAMGPDENVDVRIEVDKTFVPNRLSPASRDPRELGVRVFHAVVVEPSR
jgi:hypothetical protein